MTTNTDAQFKARFPGLDAVAFNGNQTDLEGYKPTESPLNLGMMTDIGRATVYSPDVQPNFYSKFLRAPLSRGDAVMKTAVEEINSKTYDPKAGDAALFDGSRPGFYTNVARKNLSRQIRVEVNDYVLKQHVQTKEMIGSAQAAIMATSNVAYLDDMWTASKEYFSGNLRSPKESQLHVMGKSPTDAGFGDELVELLWKVSQKDFGYKSTKFNSDGRNTRSTNVQVALKKDVEYPAFKKLLSETFNPEMLRIGIEGGIDYVDDFATPAAGAPVGAGEMIGMVVDNRAFDITPMPDTLTVEAFRNAARKSTTYFTTYEYAFSHAPFFNIAYIFAPKA